MLSIFLFGLFVCLLIFFVCFQQLPGAHEAFVCVKRETTVVFGAGLLVIAVSQGLFF
jgi:hypothetical protein